MSECSNTNMITCRI